MMMRLGAKASRRCGSVPSLKARFTVGDGIEHIQGALIGFHSVSGLPWWATFASSAVLVRVPLLPFVYYQLRASARMAKASVELSYVYQLLTRRRRELLRGDISSHIRATVTFLDATTAILRLHKAPLSAIVAPMTLQLSCFWTLVVANRGLIDAGGYGMTTGGFGPFLDLTVADPTLVLPLLAVGGTFANIELSFGRRGATPESAKADVSQSPSTSALTNSTVTQTQSPLLLLAKDVVQTFLIVSLPAISTLPAGVFFYWLVSLSLTRLQASVLSIPSVASFLGLRQQAKYLHGALK